MDVTQQERYRQLSLDDRAQYEVKKKEFEQLLALRD